ncbi:MAG: DUF11 domain-containing protein, partial [Bacteroidota bacterium]
MKNLFFVFVSLTSFYAIAQQPSLNPTVNNEVGIPSADMYVFDRFGDSVKLQDIFITSGNTRTASPCVAGIFTVTFLDDGTGEGFDDPILGAQRRTVVCQVMSDLSALIAAPGTPAGVVQIEVRKSGGLPSGVGGVASSYYLNSNLYTSGIIDGEVWKTIIGRADSYANLTGGFIAPQAFHGFIHINFPTTTNPSGVDFHLNLAQPASASGKADLYSVILHEITHTLGFYSNITSSGACVIPGRTLFSRYDTFLRTVAGSTPLITMSGCYNALFNSTSAALISGCQNVVFQGTGAAKPVYAPAGFQPGSSLSHFDQNCPTATAQYVMNSSLSAGVTKRRYTHEEANVLCDLGYFISGTYGINPGDPFTYDNTYTGCDNRIAGVNDFGYTVNAGQTTSNISNILLNDVDKNGVPPSFECLQPLIGGGSVSTSIGNAFTYTSDASFSGTAVLHYVPLSATGKKGNVTYVFINVVAPPLPTCPISNCNLVCNGDFENVTNKFASPLSNVRISPGNSPDMYPASGAFGNNIAFASWLCNNGTKIPFPNTASAPNTRFIGMGSHPSNVEVIYFPLNKTLIPGRTYRISFYAYTGCAVTVNFLFSQQAPCSAVDAINTTLNTTTNCTAGGQYIPEQIESVAVPITFNSSSVLEWRLFQQNFVAGPTNLGFLVIHLTPAASSTSSTSSRYPFLDDFSIIETTEIPLTITTSAPTSACVGDNITYSFTVCKNNPADIIPATGVTLEDVLPTGITATGGFTNLSNPSKPRITLFNGDFNAAGCAVITLNGTIGSLVVTGPNVNTLNTALGGCVSGTATNTFTTNVGVQTLTLATSVSNVTPLPGSNVTYTIEVCNSTSNPVTGIVVKDILPAGLTFVSSPNFTLSAGTLTSSTFNLAAGTPTSPACTTLTFIATVNCAPATNNVITNCATIASGGFVCNNLSSCITINVVQATLTLTTIVSNATPASNSNVTYTIEVCNPTSNPVSGIVVKDILPAGLTFVSSPNFTLSAGTLTSSTFNLAAGTPTSPACTTLTFVAMVNCVPTINNVITNCATIFSGGVICNNPSSCITLNIVLPTVTFEPLSDVCVNSPAFSLSGGSPAGGTYSGPGVTAGGIFNPATTGVGTFTITYTFTSGGCTTSATQTIKVNAATFCCTVTPGILAKNIAPGALS